MKGVHRTLTAATVAVGANALSVAAEARCRLWSKMCGGHALRCHAAAIAPAWLWFLLEEQRIERAQRKLDRGESSIVAGPLTLIGAILVVAGFRKLGTGALVNADIFSTSPTQWEMGGVYAQVAEPIYLGYGLSLAGRAARLRSREILAVAAWLSALLLVVEAPVERWAYLKVNTARAELS